MGYGDLGSVIDTLTYYSGVLTMPNDVLNVADGVYAVCFRAEANESMVKTFSVDAAGNISGVIDTIHHNIWAKESRNHIAKISPTVYAVSLCGASYALTIDTIQILASGQITDSPLDTHSWVDMGYYPENLLSVGPGMLAVVFRGLDSDGYVRTINVLGTGEIIHTFVDTLEFDEVYCNYPFLCQVSPGIYACCYQESGYTGRLKTFAITPGGTIGDSVIDTLQFDAGSITYPAMVKAHDNYFAISYRDATGNGTLKVVEISPEGVITDTVVDTYAFDTVTNSYSCVYAIGQGYVGVAYPNLAYSGVLKTFLVDEIGKLNDTTIATLQFAGYASGVPSVINVKGDVWLVTHHGPGETGTATAFDTVTPPPAAGPKDLMMGIYR